MSLEKLLSIDARLSYALRIKNPEKNRFKPFAAFFAHSGDSWFIEIALFITWLFTRSSLHQIVALMAGAAKPGEVGNIFVYGHSSAESYSAYQNIFKKLNDLEEGDEISVTYNKEDFVYVVSNKKVVEKEDISVLDPTKVETLTLMTCWPIGTADKRLIISAPRK